MDIKILQCSDCTARDELVQLNGGLILCQTCLDDSWDNDVVKPEIHNCDCKDLITDTCNDFNDKCRYYNDLVVKKESLFPDYVKYHEKDYVKQLKNGNI